MAAQSIDRPLRKYEAASLGQIVESQCVAEGVSEFRIGHHSWHLDGLTRIDLKIGVSLLCHRDVVHQESKDGLGGFAIDLPAMIGLLTLMGLVAKNSILLVEFAIEQEREGVLPRDAIMEACRQRARPIIMTTIAMVAGMIPTAIGTGEGSEFRQPMAIAIIGGLFTSTVLSLVLVPVIHLLVSSLGSMMNRVISRVLLMPSVERAAHVVSDIDHDR